MNSNIEKTIIKAIKDVNKWQSKESDNFLMQCINERLIENLSIYKKVLSRSLENLKLYDEFHILRRI